MPASVARKRADRVPHCSSLPPSDAPPHFGDQALVVYGPAGVPVIGERTAGQAVVAASRGSFTGAVSWQTTRKRWRRGSGEDRLGGCSRGYSGPGQEPRAAAGGLDLGPFRPSILLHERAPGSHPLPQTLLSLAQPQVHSTLDKGRSHLDNLDSPSYTLSSSARNSYRITSPDRPSQDAISPHLPSTQRLHFTSLLVLPLASLAPDPQWHPLAAVHAVHAVHAMTGKIKTLKLTKSRLSAASIDKLAACAARARIRDIAMLLFGIGLGVLLYALLHDLVLAFFTREPPLECPPGCMCEPLPVYREKEEDEYSVP
ncbi:hypothetical protein A1Q1_01046 [Trichosporon asahii var. asahii CBS 2479]|uniref:Uncharacterized protein n=1 Tax=Trichosporon asahii var. asahii (strain ATCC 90039 / CBS 2479 / JCM 2466 / KCTC 7840 / NBRC 103889/ NCYC 2677 / UAMH 7654) TaxID=1186058 RepID=J5QYP2_TRIAS|nr:hypothetical protein A1Q1_01046 [Trichosporon asahii var. asahii CBS 2479]EJT49803.1 hypothetical protein A1Q1_01046 [Trichosporon asahii var. asahii CBS 2479]